MRAGRYHAVFAATPCESFSVAHVPQLRTRLSPEGVTPALKRWARYLAKHNTLARFTADMMLAADEAGAVWAVENPADCGDPSGVAWWPKFASHAPLWVFPAVREALQRTRAGSVTFAQCALGAAARKFTT
eukprot:6201047-Pleurochrysis_carterae.AAC.1